MIQHQGFLNLTTARRDLAVYRIMSLGRMFQMFDERANYLVRPFKWEDPFENFISHLKGRLPTGELVEFAQRYEFFGQCWTQTGGTDAMWRIYSSDKSSVRIKVRINKLYEELARYARGIPYIGQVRYLSTHALTAWTRRVVETTKKPTIELLAKTFLVKRLAFSHENEIRLLYCATTNEEGLLYRYPFNCHGLIEEIQLDPRLADEQVAALTAEIKVHTGYRGPIVQSDLYVPPKDFVLPLNNSYATLQKTANRVTYSGDVRMTRHDEASIPQLVLLDDYIRPEAPNKNS